MNRSTRIDPMRHFLVTAAGLFAALALVFPTSGSALAAGPVAQPAPLHGLPLTGGPVQPMGEAPALDAGAALAPDAAQSGVAAMSVVRPTRVWTTDRYGYRRATFQRGETIVFWVQLYNPTRGYARHALELWADDQIRCITTPCPGGPQRLFSGVLNVRPGSTNYYLFARAEASDKVGEWTYYATDPQGETFVATRFFLR